MKQFHELFAGRDDCYGTFRVGRKADPKSKQQGKGETIHAELSIHTYENHIIGEAGLGIIPVKLDGTLEFFCIDVDTYDKETLHDELLANIERLSLPLVMTLSKSGGAHLWCFLEKPILASVGRAAALHMARMLGFPKTIEIFPKQSSVRKSDSGSWINLPYFGTARRGYGQDGEISFEEFIAYANDMMISEEDLMHCVEELINTKSPQRDTSDAPPCIDRMVEDGITEGGRDNALAHVAVYLSRKYPDDWQAQLMDFNDENIQPPLKSGDIGRIAKSQERKPHQYMCNMAPMIGVCDKPTCLKRKFGIGQGENEYGEFIVDAIRKLDTEDPTYYLTIEGKEVKCTATQLASHKLLRQRCMVALNKIAPSMKQYEWEKYLHTLLTEEMTIEAAAESTGENGLILQTFMQWVSKSAQVDTVERVMDGMPWVDLDKGEVWFSEIGFFTHYKKNVTGSVTTKAIWEALVPLGVKVIKKKVSGIQINYWVVAPESLWFEPRDNGGRF